MWGVWNVTLFAHSGITQYKNVLCERNLRTLPQGHTEISHIFEFSNKHPHHFSKNVKVMYVCTQKTLIYIVQNQEAYRANNLRLYANVIA